MKFLVIYGSITGKTEKMAGYIAESVRFGGAEVDVKPFTEVRQPEEFAGYDGYVIGGLTYHKDLLHGMKAWLFKVKEAGLEGKVGAAFGSHTHSGESPIIIHDTLNYVCKMNMLDLGPFRMEEAVVDSPAGMEACRQSGKARVEGRADARVRATGSRDPAGGDSARPPPARREARRTVHWPRGA